MKDYIVYSDYAVEYKLENEVFTVRNDLIILSIFKAKDLEEAKQKIIDECGIDDINDIEDNKVHIAEVNYIQVIDLKEV